MKRIAIFEIDCGDKLCMGCTYRSVPSFGKVWVCAMFSDPHGVAITLEDNERGSLKRCDECLRTFK